MILRVLGIQGIAGLAVSIVLALLLVFQKGETRHWKKQSGQYEQLYRGEQAGFAGTVANYRAAAEAARVADRAAAARVAVEQRAINERSSNALKLRLADARVRSNRLRVQAGTPAADPGAGRAAPMPSLSAATTGANQAAGEDRFSSNDALIATEQAIQLDELIKWVKAQSQVKTSDPSRD